VNPLIAALLGIIEGLTEYLPVSSTGHLIVASRVLGQRGEGVDAFDVVIQLGAILAVVAHYRRLLWERARGLADGKPESVSLLVALAVGFAPTAIAGLLLRRTIKTHLFGPEPVGAALIVGGVVMIVVELVRTRRKSVGSVGLEHVTPRRALIVGLGQSLSMWPGASRSMCTIVAAQLAGLSTATAAEYSFLLGLPTLGAATLYEAYRSRDALATLGAENVLVGLGVSFVVAWAVVAAFIAYLQRRGLLPFAIYRILLGSVVLFLATRG
jgi:undecaprenyl-diphosphatase